jgi:hypothetical protein
MPKTVAKARRQKRVNCIMSVVNGGWYKTSNRDPLGFIQLSAWINPTYPSCVWNETQFPLRPKFCSPIKTPVYSYHRHTEKGMRPVTVTIRGNLWL